MLPTLLRSVLIGVLLACCGPLYAQTLITNGDFSEPLKTTWNVSDKTVKASVIDVPGQQFKGALHLEISAAPANPWDARLATARIAQPLARGSLISVRFWARSADKAQIGVRYQKSQEPYARLIANNIILTPAWTEYRFYTRLNGDWAPETTNLEFHLGYGAGTLEIADIRLENITTGQVKDLEDKFGPQSINFWQGQKFDESWQTAAFARIEKYRKADLKLQIVDSIGKPIAGAKIKLVQTRQLFRWGSAVNAARLIDTQDPNNLRYQAEVKRLFNTVVFENDLKWTNDSPEKFAQTQQAAQWLHTNGIEIRGHNLVWGSRKFLPKIVVDNWDDTEKVRQLVRDRVRETAQAWKGQLYVWDVVNEAVTNTELWDKLGWDEFVNVFKIAREADPTVKLAYNDYNIANEAENPGANAKHRARVIELVKMLRAKGAPLDIVGDQAHFGIPPTAPERVGQIWAEMAQLSVPMEITEFDAGIPDDEMHGNYVRDILIAAFAEPNIQSFLMWGFWEGAQWRAKDGGAMIHKDWTPRPAEIAYENLVLNQWMTKADLLSGADGIIQTRAFLGDYTATIETNGLQKVIQFSLSKAGLDQRIALP